MKIDQFIVQAIKDIKNGIDTVNRDIPNIKVFYPSSIQIELDTSNFKDNIKNDGNHHILFTLNLTDDPYYRERYNEKYNQ